VAVFVSGAIIGGCTGTDRPNAAEHTPTTAAGSEASTDRCQIPPPGPTLDWITEDLPVPAGTYAVREVPTRDPSVRSAVLAAPVAYRDFSEFAVARWTARGWQTTKTEVESDEADSAFVRGDEWSAFQARRAYCHDNWTEVELSTGRK
jgi:hypothetical protein